jgi:ubiquinone/menaquinone biosynthesis C-methylase UbiE
MNDYSSRSTLTELIDEPGIPFKDWAVCLKELDIINTWLGGHAITLEGVKKLIDKKEHVTIAEIGCGGGDNLKAIYKWSKKRNRAVSFIGIDINEACIEFAEKNCNAIPEIRFIASDYKRVNFADDTSPDIIFSSLFCHHFTNEQLVQMLEWLRINAGVGFFINDLQRHPMAFHSIKLLTRLFSNSYLVRNDAPISVMRGFTRKEWEMLLKRAGINNYSIEWKWAFRYLITVRNA